MSRTSADIARNIVSTAVVLVEDVPVRGVTHDSRKVEKGFVFVAVEGALFDGHRFIKQAIEAGAVLVIGSNADALADAPNRILVDDPRSVLPLVANIVYNNPSRGLALVGFTGTNGKTTACAICEAMATAAGIRSGVIGTVNARWPGKEVALTHTTPEATQMCRLLSDMLADDVEAVFAEISSHALALFRVDGLDPAVGVFTNLSQDHLDFHETMEAYEAVKTSMFTRWLRESRNRRGAVVNIDDEAGVRIAALVDYNCVTCGIDNEQATLWASDIVGDLDGQTFELHGPFGHKTVTTRLVGRHNVYNILSALGVMWVMGWNLDLALAGLSRLGAVAGRMESVPNPFGFGVWVDYAHSPDSLIKALEALRPVVPGRIVTVFGAGGDRDRGKRPLMGAAVSNGSDIAVVTSDNPRTESPLAIVDDVLKGMTESYRAHHTVVAPDRGMAIELAISMARPGDGVLIAGKGHEDYQIVGKEVRHFDDREQAAEAIAALEKVRK